ncbi:hypothetical protein Pth03_03400 [Planotetraspora thailandica]|uniref:Uncharacterized protein n=1 Tax=Planotetraspora thailandica TaxID=487172 RepID=A0A8J3XTT9_9ACTN|nr:hypothetical protein Pth03_03400 [Planotetraspora thailandica]
MEVDGGTPGCHARGRAGLVVSGLLGAGSASDEGRGAPRPRGEITFGVPTPLSGDGTLRTDQRG